MLRKQLVLWLKLLAGLAEGEADFHDDGSFFLLQQQLKLLHAPHLVHDLALPLLLLQNLHVGAQAVLQHPKELLEGPLLLAFFVSGRLLFRGRRLVHLEVLHDVRHLRQDVPRHDEKLLKGEALATPLPILDHEVVHLLVCHDLDLRAFRAQLAEEVAQLADVQRPVAVPVQPLEGHFVVLQVRLQQELVVRKVDELLEVKFVVAIQVVLLDDLHRLLLGHDVKRVAEGSRALEERPHLARSQQARPLGVRLLKLLTQHVDLVRVEVRRRQREVAVL
mmetsp:Transcript_6156/g.15877  ORF Transcript_6156/g.15877 Transcript_6156/m.15877 type:complete len:277 (+) Transcript_6156:344-1174(+)